MHGGTEKMNLLFRKPTWDSNAVLIKIFTMMVLVIYFFVTVVEKELWNKRRQRCNCDTWCFDYEEKKVVCIRCRKEM